MRTEERRSASIVRNAGAPPESSLGGLFTYLVFDFDLRRVDLNDRRRVTSQRHQTPSFSMSPRTSPTSILDNRAWSEPGRLMSAGGVQFLNGGTTASGTGPTGGRLVAYRFLKTGRYLVHCMNRVHFLNDWMFGFVNVVGE
jgi:hypothetical protein